MSGLKTTWYNLYELQRGVLYLLVRVLQVQVQEVEDLALVHLASADLIVLQLVPAQNFLSLSMLCYGLYTMWLNNEAENSFGKNIFFWLIS